MKKLVIALLLIVCLGVGFERVEPQPSPRRIHGSKSTSRQRAAAQRPGPGTRHAPKKRYALRNTIQTIGEKSRDKDALCAIVGHAEIANDLSAVYNEEPGDDARLRAGTDYVPFPPATVKEAKR